MFTDTHCHWTDFAFRLPENSLVNQIIVPSTHAANWQAVADLVSLPFVRRVAFGVHPWWAHQAVDWDLLAQYLCDYPQAWVGEIGLDFYGKYAQTKIQQIDLFEKQLDLAKQFHRSIIVHQVKSIATVVASIKKLGFKGGGIAHGFSGSLEEAKSLIQCGLKIGVGVLLLNPNAKKIRQAATRLPLETLLLETDSPYMLPDNSPVRVAEIAQTLADLRGISVSDLAQQMENNLLNM